MFCTLCESPAEKFAWPPFLCGDCEESLSSQVVNVSENLGFGIAHICLRYSFDVRELVMRAKVKNDLVALGLMMNLVKKNMVDLLEDFNQPDVLIVPAPPSLWGRVRGRFDIAQMASLSLFSKAHPFLGTLPGSFWRRKRAGHNELEQSVLLDTGSLLERFINVINSIDNGDPLLKISRARRILVVDDVMTTGLTMKTIFSQLIELGAQSVEGLVIASSLPSVKEDVPGDRL